MRCRPLGVASLAICLSAGPVCAQDQADVQKLTERVKALEEKVKGLETYVNVLNGYTGERTIDLNCSSRDFQAIMPRTNTIVFLAACTGIEPYLEGYRVSLSIGNLTSFTFSNVSGKLGYGENASLTWTQFVQIPTTINLGPGTWTKLQVFINPAAAKDVRNIRLYEFNADTAQGR